MKDIIYVLCAVTGLLLVGVGLAQIQDGRGPRPRRGDIPAMVRNGASPEALETVLSPVGRSSSRCMVPAASVFNLLVGYILQMIGCALYAEKRGRSALFGLLGLLSPIGYVFLALLNPMPRSVSQDPQVSHSG